MRVLVLVLALVLPRAALGLEFDPASWMNATRDRALGALTLPGSHDSATQYLSPKLQPGRAGQLPRWVDDAVRLAESIGVPADQLVRRWARAQSARVGAQLRLGARYVDLRSGWDGDQGVWRAHHALEGQAVTEILEEVKVFLVEQPSELVIVELSHFYGDPSESAVERLATAATEIFGDMLAPYPGDARAALYDAQLGKDYVDVNHRAIVVFEDANVGKWVAHATRAHRLKVTMARRRGIYAYVVVEGSHQRVGKREAPGHARSRLQGRGSESRGGRD